MAVDQRLGQEAIGEELVELQAWYLDHLRPKLARAAQAGVVTRPDALAFDREVRGLLALRNGPGEDAA